MIVDDSHWGILKHVGDDEKADHAASDIDLIKLGDATVPSGHCDVFQGDVEIILRCRENIRTKGQSHKKLLPTFGELSTIKLSCLKLNSNNMSKRLMQELHGDTETCRHRFRLLLSTTQRPDRLICHTCLQKHNSSRDPRHQHLAPGPGACSVARGFHHLEAVSHCLWWCYATMNCGGKSSDKMMSRYWHDGICLNSRITPSFEPSSNCSNIPQQNCSWQLL